MTAKTDLPPLPERFDCTNGSAQWCYGCYTMTRDDLGDYVLAEDYDALRNASEALRAEVDALREALEEIRSRSTMNLAMQPDLFAIATMLGAIYQIADIAIDLARGKGGQEVGK